MWADVSFSIPARSRKALTLLPAELYTPQCVFAPPSSSSSQSLLTESECAAHHCSATRQVEGSFQPFDLPCAHPSTIASRFHRIDLDEACALHHIPPARRMQHRLSPPELRLLRSSIATPPVAYECDALTVRLCETGLVNKCALYQHADVPHHIGCITTADVKAGEPLGCMIGCVRPEAHLRDPSLPVDSLQRVFQYTLYNSQLGDEYVQRDGNHLMVELQSACNELRFIRGVCARCERCRSGSGFCDAHEDDGVDLEEGNVCSAFFGGQQPNVEERVIVHPRFHLPFVLVVALCPIKAGTELLNRWSPDHRRLVAQHALTTLANKGWRLHRDIAQLQRALREAEGVPHPPSHPPPAPLAAEYHAVCVTSEEAFERSGAKRIDAMESALASLHPAPLTTTDSSRPSSPFHRFPFPLDTACTRASAPVSSSAACRRSLSRSPPSGASPPKPKPTGPSRPSPSPTTWTVWPSWSSSAAATPRASSPTPTAPPSLSSSTGTCRPASPWPSTRACAAWRTRSAVRATPTRGRSTVRSWA